MSYRCGAALLLRLLLFSVLIAVGSIGATTWLAARATTGAIQDEQGRALTEDAHVYDTLLGYAATHDSWTEVEAVVHELAAQTGRRIILTTAQRAPIADSDPGKRQLPAHASATVDALSVDNGTGLPCRRPTGFASPGYQRSCCWPPSASPHWSGSGWFGRCGH